MITCSEVAHNYFCNCCHYNTCKTSSWKKHLDTAKHKMITNDNKGSENDNHSILSCQCGNIYTQKSNLSRHKKVCKMITNDNIGSEKVANTILSCQCGKIYTQKTNLSRHKKVCKMITNDNKGSEKVANTILSCQCGNTYTQKSNLSRHKKLCKFIIPENKNELTKDELIKQLIIQNQQLIFENKDFKNFMFEQNNKLIDLASKPSYINNNCNNKNQQFNLQFFLNEKCKNAMNMSDFIDSIQIGDNELEDIGKLGYIQGISNIFIKGLKDLDETMRPLHCNDIKRETLYIKDNDVWNKDDNQKKIRNAIAMIAHKNFKYIPLWTHSHPEAFDVTTKKNELYNRIANQVTTAITPDDDTGINKIIHNVACKVVIHKDNTLT